MEEINLVGEGGEDYKLTPIQAANLFAEKYLPDLDTKSVSLPREIIDHGTTPQGFDLPEIERNQIASSMVGNERNEFIQFGKHLKGSKTELSVVKYVQGSMKGLSATFWSYKQLKTYRFLGVLGKKKNKKTGKLEDCTWYNEQEYDIILILPRYKIFVVVEVKSYKGKLQAKTLDPLITGHDFFTLLLTNFGDETWKYIPVVALPNVQNRVEAENLSTKKKLDYVLVTAEEMRKNFLDVLTKDKKLKEDCATEVCVDEIYKNLVKIMFASAHSQDVSKLRGNIGIQIEDWKFTLGDTEFRSLLPDNPFDRAHERLIGEGEETVSAGFNHNLALPEYVNFSDIKGKAVSDLKSLIFWNPSQFEIINSNPKKLMISGEFGTGKTLLLMAIVQKHIINNEKVMFICDSSNSSKLFDSKIRNFCNLRDIEFHSMNVGGERDTFESLLQRQRENHLVVDELDPKNFEYICSTTNEIQQVTCVVNPQDTLAQVNELTVPEDWRKIILSKIMRNSSSIYDAAVANLPSIDRLDGVLTSTVVGKNPLCVLINTHDWYVGFLTALKMMRDEDKFVILRGDIINDTSIAWAMQAVRPDIHMYCDNAEDREEFLKSPKGCFLGKTVTSFRGMEAKSLIVASPAYSIMLKDSLLRCSTNLVFITTVKDISSINLEKWDLFIPYEQKSRHYKQRINEMENNIDIVDSIQRTLHSSLGFDH